MSRLYSLALGALIALGVAASALACSSDDEPPDEQPQVDEQRQIDEQLQIVVSTQIIADWVRQIGGEAVDVRALVPAGADVHTLELTTGDIRAIAAADLVIINGAGLESAYNDVLQENAGQLLDLVEAIEAAGHELSPFEGSMLGEEPAHDQQDHEQEQHQQGHDDADAHMQQAGQVSETVGRLLIASALEPYLSVLDLASGEVAKRLFEVAAPRSTVYASPTHRYAYVLSRGTEADDDRVHIFDGGVFLAAHDDHFDLVQEPVSRHALEIAEEQPIHFANSHGWTAIFADSTGHVHLINEAALASARGDYAPIVLETGLQRGAALAISEEQIIVSSNNPDYPAESESSLPLGVEVRTLDNEVVYDASNRSCPGLHGEAHNAHGAAFGCVGGVLFLHGHDGEYENYFIANPPEMREESRIGSIYGHHGSDHFFGKASYFDGQSFADDGVWLIDVAAEEMQQVFAAPTFQSAFSSDGQILYVLAADGVLHALDAHDGEPLDAMMELAMDDGGAPDRGAPAFVIVGEMLYLADPRLGHVLAVHLDEMEIEQEWEVGAAPSSLAFLGVVAGDGHAGHDEDDEDHADHDEGDDRHDEDDEDHAEHDEDEQGHAHAHGSEDPHFWFDVELASAAVSEIAAALVALTPQAADDVSERLDRYLAEIADADAEIRELLEGLPASQRLLVTFHDAFGYFARNYGLQVAGFVVEGPEQGVSAESIADLIGLIEREGVQTVFHEPQFDSAILDTISDETGAARGIIWSQPDDAQPTYLDIMRANAQAIADQ